MTAFRNEVLLHFTLILYFIVFETLAVQVHFNGDQVLSIIPEMPSHAGYIKEICNELQLDLWKPSYLEDVYPGGEVHVRVPSSLLHDTKQNLDRKGISFNVLIDDVQKNIDEQFVVEHKHKRSLSSFNYTKYHPMNEIYEWMDQIKETHKELVTLHYLGTTYETRPIYYFKIGLPSNRKKKIIWMDCGIHAREWISVAFCQWFIRESTMTTSPDNHNPRSDAYIISHSLKLRHKDIILKHGNHDDYNSLCTRLSGCCQTTTDQDMVNLRTSGVILQHHSYNNVMHKALENIDFYIVPVLNIDGFVYSWTTDRLWRKSRSPHDNGNCYGVDLNRNFDSKWCSIGASTNCSSLTFCGTGPASEPEVQALSQLVSSLKSDILCFLTMHSYGQLILLPYGYTKDPSVNHDEQLLVSQMAASKIAEAHGAQYRVGSASHILYNNSGSSRDWAADLGIPFSYTFELRDNGTYGFILPEHQIQPTCEEATAGIMSIVNYLNEKHFNSASNIFSGGLWINLSFSVVTGTYYSLYY